MKKLYLGIDFGTSKTSISYLNKNGDIKVLKYNNSSTIPSVISFNKEIKCGINIDDKNVLREFKTEILNKNFKFLEMNINQILVIYFKFLKTIITTKLGNYENIEIVASVPSEFNDNSRKLIKKCYQQAGFNVKRLINEPTSAALSFGLENLIEDEKILVVDIGGGTSDFSILEIDDGFFEVVDSYGLNDIGGKTVNNKLKRFLKNKLKRKYNYDFHNIELIKRKINLIKRYNDKYIQLNYKDFEKIILDLIIKYEEVLNKIKLKHQIKKIIMVGGGSNLYIIHELITRIFGNIILPNQFLNSCVAKGCCYYLGNLYNLLNIKSDITVVDVNPLSLGIELTNGNFSIIIPKNTPIPTSMTQRYTLDNIFAKQRDLEKIVVKVYQGERKLAKDNIMVGNIDYTIKSKTVNHIFSITFKLSSESMIFITIVDETNNDKMEYSLENKIDYNFVDDHLTLSLNNYHEDIKNYQRNEKIYLARIILENKLNDINNNLSIDNVKKNELLEKNLDLLKNINDFNNEKLDYIIDNNINHKIISNDEYNEKAKIDEHIKKDMLENRRKRVEEIIEELLLIQDKSEEENTYLYSATDILQTTNHTTTDLDNIINTYDFLKRKDYKKELEYLIKYLRSNICDFDLSSENQYIIKKYLEKCEINVIKNKEYKKFIKKINNLCEKIYNTS